jgi:transposase
MKVITIGLDIAKRVFQAHGVDAAGRAVVRRKLGRSEVLTSSAPCRPAWSASRPVARRSIGQARAAHSGTRCG